MRRCRCCCSALLLVAISAACCVGHESHARHTHTRHSSSSSSSSSSSTADGGNVTHASGDAWAGLSRLLPAAPWLVPAGVRLPYDDLHGDLDQLLRVQQRGQPAGTGAAGVEGGSGRRVTLTLFTAALRHMLLNWVFTLVTYGGVDGFVVATVDNDSLISCLALRLPCWDARGVVPGLEGDVDASSSLGREEQLNSPAGSLYSRLTHGKPNLSLEVMRKGYDLHFADVDMVFVRDVWRSFDKLLADTKADGSFMREEQRYVNSGHYVLLNNERTLRFMEAWAADRREKWTLAEDQQWLRSQWMMGKAWKMCDGPEEVAAGTTALPACSEVTSTPVLLSGSGGNGSTGALAAIYCYVEQAAAKPFGSCPNRFPYQHCAPWQVALHYICIRGQQDKINLMRQHGLWFVADDGDESRTPTPWFVDAHDGAGPAAAATALPCEDPVALLRRKADPPDEKKQGQT